MSDPVRPPSPPPAPTAPPTPPVWSGAPPPDRGVRRWDSAGLIWGLVLLVVGGYFFLQQTLGIDIPSIPWSAIWPIILIVIGGAIILRGLGRSRR